MLPKELREMISETRPCAAMINHDDGKVRFLLITRDGVYKDYTGTNYAKWPLSRYPMPTEAEVKKLLADIKQQKVNPASARKNTLYPFVARIYAYNGRLNTHSMRVTSSELTAYITQLLDFKNSVFFAFMNLTNIGHEIKLFETYDEMVQDFISRHELTPWEALYELDPDLTREYLTRTSGAEGLPLCISEQEAIAKRLMPKNNI